MVVGKDVCLTIHVQYRYTILEIRKLGHNQLVLASYVRKAKLVKRPATFDLLSAEVFDRTSNIRREFSCHLAQTSPRVISPQLIPP
jgi:hypothetical protein